MKKLYEKRALLIEEAQGIITSASTETRAMTGEETTRYNAIKEEISAIDTTIKAEEETRALVKKIPTATIESKTTEEMEARAFENYIRGAVGETRADVNLPASTNGAVIPSTIANKIIEAVTNISPLFAMATKYTIGGTLNIPYYDTATQKITMAYATEFTELESTSGKYATIELKGFLAGCLTKISKSLIANSQFDIVGHTINVMATEIARWIENELINGTTNKVDGLKGVTLNKTAASATAITADELIDVQELVPDVYQGNAVWIMSKDARTAIRKLKDTDGAYLLNKDATAKWGYTLFGKDVYVSDNISAPSSGKIALYYGDMSGLAVKMADGIEIQTVLEKFATQHAIGVYGWVEIDSKVENAQKIAKLTMKV